MLVRLYVVTFVWGKGEVLFSDHSKKWKDCSLATLQGQPFIWIIPISQESSWINYQVVVSNICYLHPLGQLSNLTHIFEMGSNHQLDLLEVYPASESSIAYQLGTKSDPTALQGHPKKNGPVLFLSYWLWIHEFFKLRYNTNTWAYQRLSKRSPQNHKCYLSFRGFERISKSRTRKSLVVRTKRQWKKRSGHHARWMLFSSVLFPTSNDEVASD